jgi:hypothetical protein
MTESILIRIFLSLTDNFEGFPGDGIVTYDQYMIIHLNKDYGSEVILMDVTEDFKGIPKILKSFTFETSINEFFISGGVVNFLSNNVIFQLDLTPYKTLKSTNELLDILDANYLVSTYLYDSKVPIKRILGRFGENLKQGMAIIGLLIRHARNTVTFSRRRQSLTQLSVTISAKQLLHDEV